VIAGAGLAVAKHGECAASSAVAARMCLPRWRECLSVAKFRKVSERDRNLFHVRPAISWPTARVASLRRELGVADDFHRSGLDDPAHAPRQIIGRVEPQGHRTAASALALLGTDARGLCMARMAWMK